MSVSIDNFKTKLIKQIDMFNYENNEVEFDKIIFEEALQRLRNCLKFVKTKYLDDSIINSNLGFDPYNSVQASMFNYYLANSYYNHFSNNIISESLYLLNKALYSFELYYNRKLPDFWYMDHPLGSIIGNATYSNGIFVQQGVTIGANKGIVRPTFAGYTMLFTQAVLVGDCKIGKNVIVSANTYIKETDIPDNCIVFGQSPNLIIKQKSEEYMRNFFSDFFISE